MAINLTKGESISLTKEDQALNKITVGLGWRPRVTPGDKFDLDCSVLLLGKDEKAAPVPMSLIYFNCRKSACDSVAHLGDNRSGEGEGDDERVKVNLDTVPKEVEKLLFIVNIYHGEQKGQSFSQVSDAFIRIINEADSEEFARYNLSEQAPWLTLMTFGELYRQDAGWQFKALGNGFNESLTECLAHYGLA